MLKINIQSPLKAAKSELIDRKMGVTLSLPGIVEIRDAVILSWNRMVQTSCRLVVKEKCRNIYRSGHLMETKWSVLGGEVGKSLYVEFPIVTKTIFPKGYRK